jgi:hypothetical protein
MRGDQPMPAFSSFGLRAIGGRSCHFESLERRDLLTGVAPRVVAVEVSSTAWSPDFVNAVRGTNQYSVGYPIPVGSAAQLNSLTWKNIDQIILRFDKDVDIDEADLSLSGVNTISYAFSKFHYDPIGHVAIWTLTAPLNKDRVQIDLDTNGAKPVSDLDGNVLDGEWTNKVSTISGNGTAGGDFQFQFNVLPTDCDNTGRITTVDYSLIYNLTGKLLGTAGYVASRDIDGNGSIDIGDWLEAVLRFNDQRPPGSPTGTGDDAPTTSGFGLVNITDDAVDVAISLLSGFNDAESGSNGLTYSIASNSNPELFDSLSIDSASHSLVMNAADGASGRATIEITATDPSGLSTTAIVTVDVNRENQPPVITDFLVVHVDYDTYVVSGRVSDPDDDVSNFIVQFTGAFNMRAAVDDTGNFLFATIIDNSNADTEYAITTDPHGLSSNQAEQSVVLT